MCVCMLKIGHVHNINTRNRFKLSVLVTLAPVCFKAITVKNNEICIYINLVRKKKVR